jgi:hypothetical protein
VLVDRKTQLLRTAQTEMQSLAANSAAPIEELDAMIVKYEAYPDDVRMARDALTSAHKLRLTGEREAHTVQMGCRPSGR